MSWTYFYRIPKINNLEDAIPAINDDINRKRPAKLVEFVKNNDIQNLTPEIKFSDAELSGDYSKDHSLLMTFMLAVLERPEDATPIDNNWYHELILQTEERKVTYLSDEQQDLLYEFLLQIHPMWGNIGADTEPFDFPGFLHKEQVQDLLELLKNIAFKEDIYIIGSQELILALQEAVSKNRELVLECQH